MQKFNVDNVEARFIKNLLLNTYLPNFPIACVGDFIVGGCYYVYGNFVIRCDTSGVLTTPYDTSHLENIKYVKGYNNNGSLFNKMSPTPSDFALCSTDFYCGVGIRAATYTAVCSFNHEKQLSGVTSNYISHSHIYDVGTHKQLGRYLRWYKSAYGVDLMPMYNCFVNHDITHSYLTSKGVQDGVRSNQTVWVIPALLNKTYQIFINSPSTVMVKGVFMNDFGRVRHKVDGEKVYLDTLLTDGVKIYNDTSYNNPITYTSFTNDSNLIQYSNDFYIMVQVPSTHSGSIVVIEGETQRQTHNIITSGEVYVGREGEWPTIDYSAFSPLVTPSIAIISGKSQLPYSDRLMEYLVGSAIHSAEDVPNNIYRLQDKLNITNKYNTDKDVWNNIIKYLLYNKHFAYTEKRYFNSNNPTQEEISKLPESKLVYKDGQLVGLKDMNNHMPTNVKYDILGFCDKDVENSLFKYKEV
jgi:hypothetical protein